MLLIEKLSMRSKACDIKRREFHIYIYVYLIYDGTALVLIDRRLFLRRSRGVGAAEISLLSQTI